MRRVLWIVAAALAGFAPTTASADPGYVYDAPYAPYYYSPYPYYYPWAPPPGIYGPSQGDFGGDQVIPAGRLLLMVDPVSADVYVDGRKLSPRRDLTYQVGLLVGNHTVEVRADGYRTHRQEVDLRPNRRTVLTIRLQR
ncbi:PEGA domain-containing protein [Thioalbus denitrificans]|uniref:PEGA domain-containing protein n=1 Tax=Thioalbus denitrificans TaxID=547122 RepID=A0A369CAT5_9GAMM|nr:PEGA domain-containing protein [Thioalbus denitrificans]RCX31142.1 PEGA domain-containing protein [Thioalbus denitrificans]